MSVIALNIHRDGIISLLVCKLAEKVANYQVTNFQAAKKVKEETYKRENFISVSRVR